MRESPLVLTAAFRDSPPAGLIVPIAFIEIVTSWISSITPLYADAAARCRRPVLRLLFTYAGALGVVFQMPVTHATEHMRGSVIVLWSGAVLAVAFACLFMSATLPSLVAAVDFTGAGRDAVWTAGADHRC